MAEQCWLYTDSVSEHMLFAPCLCCCCAWNYIECWNPDPASGIRSLYVINWWPLLLLWCLCTLDIVFVWSGHTELTLPEQWSLSSIGLLRTFINEFNQLLWTSKRIVFVSWSGIVNCEPSEVSRMYFLWSSRHFPYLKHIVTSSHFPLVFLTVVMALTELSKWCSCSSMHKQQSVGFSRCASHTYAAYIQIYKLHVHTCVFVSLMHYSFCMHE